MNVTFLKLKHFKCYICYQAPKIWNLLGTNSSLCNLVLNIPFDKPYKVWIEILLLKIQSECSCIQANSSIEVYSNMMKNVTNLSRFQKKLRDYWYVSSIENLLSINISRGVFGKKVKLRWLHSASSFTLCSERVSPLCCMLPSRIQDFLLVVVSTGRV